jgi:catechol 2,3-dioxygenase-like lactoylglutathione lyase family enzyme
MNFSHVGICVADLERSLRFYCEGLGFEAAEGFDLDDTMMPGLAEALEVESPTSLRSQMITKGELKIELLAYERPKVVGSPSASRGQLGLTHLNFIVDDIEAEAERLVGLGGTVLPSTRVSVGVEILFLADPDGTRVELMKY